MRSVSFATLLSVIAIGQIAQAEIISTRTFGELAGATFGGTGIPNDAVAIRTYTDTALGYTITLGLTAHARYDAPVVTNNGTDTFYATAGLAGTPAAALWNLGYYIAVSGASWDISDFQFTLEYDVSANGTDFGRVLPPAFAAPLIPTGTTVIQDSQNLTFAFLNPPGDGMFIDAPTNPFNPFAGGTYNFILRAYQSGGYPTNELANIAANVVIAAVPEPATLTGLTLGGYGLLMAGTRRRFAA